MFDIITIGHATIDYFLKLSKAEVVMPDHGDSRLCLDFADKIPVEAFDKAVGGNAPNAAVGCTRLGLKTALVSWVGRDLEAEVLLKTLKGEGVEVFWMAISEDERTDLSVILNYQGERTILAYHFPRTYRLPVKPPRGKWIYLTSAGKDFRGFHDEMLKYLEGREVKLAYNPGMHEIAAGREANLDILNRCEILFLNSEEVGEMGVDGFVKYSDSTRAEEIGGLASQLRETGPKIVVVTDGAGGSYAADGENFLHAPSVPTEVVEATGAGDSFAAGFLSAQILDKGIEECLKWGNINAASVISKVGSQAGLLTRDEIKQKLKV